MKSLKARTSFPLLVSLESSAAATPFLASVQLGFSLAAGQVGTAGEAALFSLAVASSIVPDLLGPALGVGVGLAGLGLGGMSMTRTRSGSGPCPGGQCRAQQSRQCCGILVMNGRQVCPLAC